MTLTDCVLLFSLQEMKLLWKQHFSMEFRLCTKTPDASVVLSSSSCLYILNFTTSSSPLLYEILPSHHTNEISTMLMDKNILFTGSSHLSYHKIKYASKYDGLSVGMEVKEDENDATLMEELETQSSRQNVSSDKKESLSLVKRTARRIVSMTEKQNYLELRMMQVSMLVVFMQRCAFAFKVIEIPSWYVEFQATFEEVTDIISVVDVLFTWEFQYTIVVAFTAVGVFVLSFAVQETIEMKKFLNPDNKFYGFIWSILSSLCGLFSGVLVIPITSILMKVLKCESHDTDPTKLGEYLSASLERAEDFLCWNSTHYIYVIIGVISLLVYIPIAIRFIRVDKKLESLEVNTNFFDWKSDIMDQEDRKHEMSLKDTKAERASFVVGVLLSMCGTFVEDEVSTQSAVYNLFFLFFFLALMLS